LDSEAANLEISVPSIFVVAHDAKHRGELNAALSPYFQVQVFSDAS